MAISKIEGRESHQLRERKESKIKDYESDAHPEKWSKTFLFPVSLDGNA
jgi:hypothetical protein